MTLLDLLLLTLAAFYLGYAISSTEGPFGAFAWLRAHLPLGGLTACIVCLVVWLAGALYLVMLTPLIPLVYILAAAGASVFIWRWTGGANL